MKFIAILLTMAGCGGSIVKSSRHDIVADGEITVTQRIEVDTSVCDKFPDEERRLKCIETILATMEKAVEKDEGTNAIP